MTECLCRYIIGGMALGFVGLAGGFWRILVFWKKESQGRLRDAKELNSHLRRHLNETETR